MDDFYVYYRNGDCMDDVNAETYALVFWIESADDPVPFGMSCIDVNNIENQLQLSDPDLLDDIPALIKGQEEDGPLLSYGRVFMIGGNFFLLELLKIQR